MISKKRIILALPVLIITGFIIISNINLNQKTIGSSDIQVSEQETEKGKIIMISGEDGLENVLAYTELSKEAPEEKIHLYNLIDGEKQEVEVEKYDKDNNGLIDYIEWIVPHLSEQTYELEIIILDAEHLNENKEFVANIFAEVNTTDDITYTIPKNQYARVYFERNLTNGNVIDIFIRNTQPTTIEIYEKDSDIVIGRLEDIATGLYFINLNHSGSQSIFDLKSIGNEIIYDYVHDATPVCAAGTCTVTFTLSETWEVVAGATGITGLVIGGGGGGLSSGSAGGGGAGGDLRSSTELGAVPGETLTIIVGAGGASTPTKGGYSSIKFQNGTTALLAGGGGEGHLDTGNASANGTSTAIAGVVSGGSGGAGGTVSNNDAGGGGGASGYTGNGGDGGDANLPGAKGAGGGGGGGGAGGNNAVAGAGGGVGTDGEGLSGGAGAKGGGTGYQGEGGSSGTGDNSTTNSTGGFYGGGGGGADSASGGGPGGSGIVVITYVDPAGDSCDVGAGNWDITCSDNCSWGDPIIVPANITMTGGGVLTLGANMAFSNDNWKIVKDNECEFVINSSGGIT